MKKIPVVDLGKCTDCNSCIDICPMVFRKNSDTDLLEVDDLEEYPEAEIMEAISLCPADCITWEITD